MLAEEDVKRLIEQRSETKNLDYKETLNWLTCKTDGKLELVKDLLAMANTQDGGRIVFGVVDKTNDFVGMPGEDWQSFDPTKVNEFARKYAGPSFSCQVYKHVIEAKRVACIDVPEFDRGPVVCEADGNSSLDPAKLILKKGTLYIRTRKPSSEAVHSAEEMRELLERALLKKGDELLHSIEQLIKGKAQSASEESRTRYAQEINDAEAGLCSELGGAFGDFGYWQVVAHPVSYDPGRIRQIAEIGKLMHDSEVWLGRSTFPHTDPRNTVNFAEGKQSISISVVRHAQGYRAYRSGLFVWRGVLWEDTLGYRTEGGHRMFVYPVLVYDVTEFILFCKRYYERLNPESVSIGISLSGMKDRRLYSGPEIDLCGISREPSIGREETISLAELRASNDEIAIRFLKHILALFNVEDVSDETLSQWQKRLYEGRI